MTKREKGARHKLGGLFDDPDLVDRVFEYIATQFPEVAGALSMRMKEDLRAEFGGREIYVPSTSRRQRDERVRAVLSSFNGRNASEVARVLGISRPTVYRILKQAGKP